MAESDVTRHNAAHAEGMGGLSMPQVGVWGASPTKFLANISPEKGILEQF